MALIFSSKEKAECISLNAKFCSIRSGTWQSCPILFSSAPCIWQPFITCSFWLGDVVPAKARSCDKAPLHLQQLFLQGCSACRWTEGLTQPALRHGGKAIKTTFECSFILFDSDCSAEDYLQHSLYSSHLGLWVWWTAERRACLKRPDISESMLHSFIPWADLHFMSLLSFAVVRRAPVILLRVYHGSW